MNHDSGGGGGGGGMVAKRILKVPSLISLGALEFQCPKFSSVV